MPYQDNALIMIAMRIPVAAPAPSSIAHRFQPVAARYAAKAFFQIPASTASDRNAWIPFVRFMF
jgi:hypothetical protein